MAKRVDYTTPTTEQLDEVAFIAARMGHDGEAKRAACAKMTMAQVSELISASTAYCRRNNISLAVDTSGHPATDRQVSYIMDLLANRTTGAGFAGIVPSLYTDGKPNRTAVAKLTRADASNVIDSLRETY